MNVGPDMPAAASSRLSVLLPCLLVYLSAGWIHGAPTNSSTVSSTLPDLGGFYKNLLSVTDVRHNYQNLGLTPQGFAVDDYQRFRIKFDYEPVPEFDIKIHYEIRLAYGETVRIQNQLSRFNPGMLPNISTFLSQEARPRFLRLESNPVREKELFLVQDLDRLQLRYRKSDYEISLGRQAVTWGSGLIWNPIDLFSGFAPTEIDRDEKLGVDVARFNWAPTFGTALDIVAEPLDNEAPYRIDSQDSSLAARATTKVGEYDLGFLGGYIANDWVVGGDFTGYLKNAGLRGELIYTFVREEDERDYFRALLSIDYAFNTRWNPYLAVEYFFNGLGTDDPDDYLERLTDSSVQRAFMRGNAFNIGRHYIGVVGRVMPNSLLSLQSVTLWNMLDGSVRELASATWSLSENLDFELGINFGVGQLGTEFGGFSEDQIGVNYRIPNFVFGFLKYYF
jgi:hypothetical protein